MFKSKSLGLHLLRGLSGFGLFVVALAGRLPGWAVIVCLVSGIVLLRGCPMCWAVGLIETVFDKTGATKPTGLTCRVPTPSAPEIPRVRD